LQAIVSDRNLQRKHIERAQVGLASHKRRAGAAHRGRARHQSADGLALAATLRRGGCRWSASRQDAQARQAADRAEMVAGVVALTCAGPPHQATHWTGRAMAKAAGISLRSVQRIWAAHDLQPHRARTFKRWSDPHFAAKMADVVGLYLDPPAHAVVLSIDETAKSRRATALSPDFR
jgi:hypothetical protein